MSSDDKSISTLEQDSDGVYKASQTSFFFLAKHTLEKEIQQVLQREKRPLVC